jgi:hypothetical protein
MANEVKGIEVLPDFLGQRIEQQTFRLQFVNDGLLTFSAFPAFEELIEACKMTGERLLRVVTQAFGDQFAVLVEIFDPFGEDP